MKTILLLIVLSSASAFAQKNMYEAKWGSQGNGGGEYVGFLNQPLAQTCVPRTNICVSGAHGALRVADFGTGPFLIDDEGYVFTFPVWSETVRPELDVRTFANGVH